MRAILAIAHNAFVSLDAGGAVVEWNPRAEEMFGYSREEAIGRDVAELIVPARYRAAYHAGLRRMLATATAGTAPPTRLQLEALRRDGEELPVEVSVTAAPEGDAWRLHGWIQDVSERRELLQQLEAQLREGQPGFAEILDALAEAVTIRDPYNHIIYANRAALHHMGFDTLEEMQRRPPGSIFSDYLVHDEDGRELTMEDIPSVRVLAGQPADSLVIRTISRKSGEVSWNLLKASALRDQDGVIVATVMIIEDVTREKTSELRDRFLARAMETLLSSLDYEETLRNVAWLVVPEMADWCAVDLLDDAGRRQRVVVAHRDPSKVQIAERLRSFEPEELDPERGLGRVVRTGVSELFADITEEMVVGAARDDEHLRLLRQIGLRSVVLVPLRARGRTLGVMTLVNAESRRRFGNADVEFAEALAGRAAVAVDNARLATARHEIASTLQRSLLPETVPPMEGWRVATMYRAARRADEVEVGGDFYDFIGTADGWIVLLGDVTGKGVEAAAMTSLVRHGARFFSKQEQRPSAILAHLNDALREQPGMWLCSAVCASLREDHIVICSAGHPAPLIVRDDGRIREIGVNGPILGAWSGGAPIERSVEIGSDETLFLYTDGVTDTRGESDRFGASRLRGVLSGHAGLAPADLLAVLEDALSHFQQQIQYDDTAVVALRPVRSPAHAQAPTGPETAPVRNLRSA